MLPEALVALHQAVCSIYAYLSQVYSTGLLEDTIDSPSVGKTFPHCVLSRHSDFVI